MERTGGSGCFGLRVPGSENWRSSTVLAAGGSQTAARAWGGWLEEHERDRGTNNESRDGCVNVFCIQYRCIYIYTNDSWNGNFRKGT